MRHKTGSSASPFGFAGQHGYQEDADSGLKLLGHRYYDASTGRFLTRDQAYDGRNWYAYAENNPHRFIDPDGQVVIVLFYVGMGLGAGAAVLWDAATRKPKLGKNKGGGGGGSSGGSNTGGSKPPKGTGKKPPSKAPPKMNPAESPVWRGKENAGRPGRKMDGTGKDRKYYEWDRTHGDIEVYDDKGRHLGSMDPTSGTMTKPPVNGRTIDL